jgi:hypothetical protein
MAVEWASKRLSGSPNRHTNRTSRPAESAHYGSLAPSPIHPTLDGNGNVIEREAAVPVLSGSRNLGVGMPWGIFLGPVTGVKSA